MGWAFWRRSTAEGGDDTPGGGDRERDDADPAAELRRRTRRRLIGAAALLLIAVFVVPMLLDPTPRPVPDTVAISMPSQPAPISAVPEPARGAEADSSKRVDGGFESAPTDAPAKASKSAAEARPVAPAESERFALQVAAMATVGAANQLAARLKKAGFIAYVEAIKTAEGPRHRVRVGPFASREEAQRASEKLRAAGFAAALVTA